MVTTLFEGYKPYRMDRDVWLAILEGWENGLSDQEVCFRVTKQTGKNLKFDELKRLVHEDKEIADLREHLRSSLVVDSKLNIADAIREGDTPTAKWYLERRSPEEFSTKSSIAFDEASKITVSIEDKEQALMEMIENFNDGE